MKRDELRGLIFLNAALLGVLALVAIGPSVVAQGGQPDARARGEYTAVSGRVLGSTTNAVYILDSTNQEIVALRWNRNRNQFEGIGYRSLVQDAQVQQRAR